MCFKNWLCEQEGNENSYSSGNERSFLFEIDEEKDKVYVSSLGWKMYSIRGE